MTPGHAYSTPSHLSSDAKSNSQQSSVFFISDDLRNSILLKNELSNTHQNDSQNLPLEVDNFHSVTLLETSNLPVPTSSTYIGKLINDQNRNNETNHFAPSYVFITRNCSYSYFDWN